MKKWILVLLLLSGCVLKKKSSENDPIDYLNVVKAKNIGQAFKNHLEDPQVDLGAALQDCANGSCDDSSERSLALRLRSLYLALKARNKNEVLAQAPGAVQDFKKLLPTYSEQREFIVPVAYEAWFFASNINQYNKQIAQELFAEAKNTRKELEGRSPKPTHYYFLAALETELASGSEVEKVQAYKKCMDMETSSKRCQESYLRLSAQAPTAIKASEMNLSRQCRPQVDKAGFTLHAASTTKNKKWGKPKSFAGKKYYFEKEPFLNVSDIETLFWTRKPASVLVRTTDSGFAQMQKAATKLKGQSLILVKKDQIYGSVMAGPSVRSRPREIKIPNVDAKGLSAFVSDCQ